MYTGTYHTLYIAAQTAKDVVAKVVQELGRLDILVNNASEQHVKHELTEISAEQLQQTFKTNVFGYFYFAQVSQCTRLEISAVCDAHTELQCVHSFMCTYTCRNSKAVVLS